MKNLLEVLVIMLSIGVYAQNTETKTQKQAASFCCPKCDYCAAQAGSCPHHQVALAEGDAQTMYCCGHCDWTIPPVKGQCHHSTYTVYKEGTMYCVFCHDIDGKCSNCGMQMEKIVVKKKKK